jgi:cytochrome c-type biogenesis protein CcmE
MDIQSGSKKFNKRLLIGIIVIITTTLYLISLSLDSASAVYMTPSQLIDSQINEERRLRLGGSVLEGSISYGETRLDLVFYVVDEEASVKVDYYGVVPDIFGDNAVVFVEGYFDRSSNILNADLLLTKHPDTMEPLTENTLNSGYPKEY